MQYNQCLAGKTNWASRIKNMLYKFGFGWIWEQQSIPETLNFVKEFKERLQDNEIQSWASDVKDISKLRTYCIFKEGRKEESYLSVDIPRRLKKQIARFRTGSHNLEIEVGRHNKIALDDRVCKHCRDNCNRSVIEDEFHVLLECPKYEDIREFYIRKHCVNVNIRSFVAVMSSEDKECIVDLANFIYSMFKRRNSSRV